MDNVEIAKDKFRRIRDTYSDSLKTLYSLLDIPSPYNPTYLSPYSSVRYVGTWDLKWEEVEGILERIDFDDAHFKDKNYKFVYPNLPTSYIKEFIRFCKQLSKSLSDLEKKLYVLRRKVKINNLESEMKRLKGEINNG